MVTKRLLLRAVLEVLPILEKEFLSQKHFTSYGKIVYNLSIRSMERLYTIYYIYSILYIFHVLNCIYLYSLGITRETETQIM